MKKKWKVQAFLKSGPLVLFLTISKMNVGFKTRSIRFEFFFNKPESVSGWMLQELLMPKAMYRVITKAVRKARFSLENAVISCSFSKKGNSIVITVVRREVKIYSIPKCVLSVIDKSRKFEDKERRKGFCPFRFVSP